MIDSVIHIFGTSIFVPAAAKQMLLAAVFGLAIGLDRSLRRKQASFGTFSMICTGSCLFGLLSVQGDGASTYGLPHDSTRIAAQVVSGIGFIGGGVIFKTADRVEGLTTGAMIWLAAAIGLACGFNQIEIVIWAFVIGVMNHFLSIVFHGLVNFVQRVPASERHQHRPDLE